MQTGRGNSNAGHSGDECMSTGKGTLWPLPRAGQTLRKGGGRPPLPERIGRVPLEPSINAFRQLSLTKGNQRRKGQSTNRAIKSECLIHTENYSLFAGK